MRLKKVALYILVAAKIVISKSLNLYVSLPLTIQSVLQTQLKLKEVAISLIFIKLLITHQVLTQIILQITV